MRSRPTSSPRTIRTANSTCSTAPTASIIASFGRVGHNAGEFDNLHNLAIDSKGNIYAAEVQGKRVQKFRNLGGL